MPETREYNAPPPDLSRWTPGVAGTVTRPDVRCPNCRAVLPESLPWPSRCDQCGAKIAVLDFDPPAMVVDEAQAAMPDDVPCAFHPNKKAVAICAGTGSYICALCVVPIGDKTYSTEFINAGGLAEIGKADAFERTLKRPDLASCTTSVLALVLSCMMIGPVLLPFAIWYATRHFKLLKTSSLYAKASGTSGSVSVVLCLILFGFGSLVMPLLVFLGLAWDL